MVYVNTFQDTASMNPGSEQQESLLLLLLSFTGDGYGATSGMIILQSPKAYFRHDGGLWLCIKRQEKIQLFTTQ